MNSIFKQIIIFITGTIIGALSFYYYVGIDFTSFSLTKEYAIIIAALITAIVTIIGYFITRYNEKKKIAEQEIVAQKLPTYEEFVDLILDVFQQAKGVKKTTGKDLEKKVWNMNKKAILWMSDNTFLAYSEWKNKTVEFSQIEDKNHLDNEKIIKNLGTLLVAFRKDIGHKNKQLNEDTILSLFITDWKK